MLPRARYGSSLKARSLSLIKWAIKSMHTATQKLAKLLDCRLKGTLSTMKEFYCITKYMLWWFRMKTTQNTKATVWHRTFTCITCRLVTRCWCTLRMVRNAHNFTFQTTIFTITFIRNCRKMWSNWISTKNTAC